MVAPTITASVPIFTATALAGAQFIGYVCALTIPYSVAGGAFGSGATNIDSGGVPFGENSNAGTLLSIGATATGTNSTGTFTNQSKRGFNLFLNILSIAATCTIRMTYQEADPTVGNLVNIFTASIDAQATAAAPETFLMQVYPGIVAPGIGVGANLFIVPVAGGLSSKVTVSITATASGGGANINYNVAVVQLP